MTQNTSCMTKLKNYLFPKKEYMISDFLSDLLLNSYKTHMRDIFINNKKTVMDVKFNSTEKINFKNKIENGIENEKHETSVNYTKLIFIGNIKHSDEKINIKELEQKFNLKSFRKQFKNNDSKYNGGYLLNSVFNFKREPMEFIKHFIKYNYYVLN